MATDTTAPRQPETSNPATMLGLPPADQIGLVVRDLATAMAQYEPLFGPFTVVEGTVAAATYRGAPADCHLKCAFGRSGNLEVELVEWVWGHSPHREFIESGREGLQHIRFPVTDIDHWIEKAAAFGYQPIWSKVWSEDLTFAYLERSGDPTLIEFVQMR
jgi:methylmalonyl-CoA/ethylmalonyl-CoA epimerase